VAEGLRRLEGRAALVTGAASGIGRATCERFAAEGARIACVDQDGDAAEALAKALVARGSDAIALACDVSSEDQVDHAVDAAVSRFGELRILVNSAGILHFTHTHEETLERWNRLLAVNLTGTFLMCRAALPWLRADLQAHDGGAIVNVSSTAALRAHAWTAAYSASKGGVKALTLELAIEYGRQGVRTNCVCPGGITTPMHGAFSLPEGADPKLLQRIMPFDTMRGPEHCAGVIAFLASDDAAHVNGEDVRVDGAMCT
jgi:NAD(P)-dependent dehydrogenase (short-subunit alcohol dehydrogenase family)